MNEGLNETIAWIDMELARLMNQPVSDEDAFLILGIVVLAGIAAIFILWGIVTLGRIPWKALFSPVLRAPESLKAALEKGRAVLETSKARKIAKKKASKPAKQPKQQPVERNWAWVLGQVEEAQEDREFTLMHPIRARQPRGVKALARHRKRWMRMAKAPGGLLDGLMLYIMPAKAYKQTFIKSLTFERDDEVEPEIPTAIVETWLPKAAVADQPNKWRCDVTGGNVMHSPNAYMRLTLPPGMLVSELLYMKQYYTLENDDYRMEDIIHVERRAANRELQSTGVLAAHVDSLEPVNPLNQFLSEWWPIIVGVLLPVIMGTIFVVVAGG